MIQRHQRRAQRFRAGEIELHRRIIGRFGNRLHLGQRLLPALCLLGGGGAGAVAGDIILQFGALRGLGGAGGLQLRQPFGTLPFETVVIAGVKLHLAAFEVQDHARHSVQQITLVADQYDQAGIGFQEIFQPQGRFQIEVVRRFVEQQHIGPGEQQRRQRHTHAPTTGIAVERTALHVLVKTQAHQDSRSASGGGVSINSDQPLVNIGHTFRRSAGVFLGDQRSAFGIGGQHGFKRRALPHWGFLLQPAQPCAARPFNAAAIRIDGAGHHLHHRGFAGAVAADQANTAARRQRSAGAVDDGAPAKANGEVLNRQHDARRLAG